MIFTKLAVIVLRLMEEITGWYYYPVAGWPRKVYVHRNEVRVWEDRIYRLFLSSPIRQDHAETDSKALRFLSLLGSDDLNNRDEDDPAVIQRLRTLGLLNSDGRLVSAEEKAVIQRFISISLRGVMLTPRVIDTMDYT